MWPARILPCGRAVCRHSGIGLQSQGDRGNDPKWIGDRALNLLDSRPVLQDQSGSASEWASLAAVAASPWGLKLLVQIHILECVDFDGGFQAEAASKRPSEEEGN